MTRYRFDSKKNFTVLDLFSGIGGFSLGLEATGAFSTVAFCEQDRFCQAVLRKHWPNTPIFDDIRTLPTDRFRGVDICVGGFPCQPWSAAGKKRGAEDDRDLWPEMFRVIEAVQAEWIIGENVRGFVNEPLGLRRSLSDLESIGYQAVPFVIPACSVNAPHRRDRCWIIGHKKNVGDTKHNGSFTAAIRQGFDQASNNDPQGQNSPIQFERASQPQSRVINEIIAHTNSKSEPDSSLDDYKGSRKLGATKNVADTQRQRQQRQGVHGRPSNSEKDTDRQADQLNNSGEKETAVWLPQQCLGLPPDGLSRWVAGDWERGIPRVTEGEEGRAMKLKALGNSVVPQVVEQIGRAIVSAY